MIAEVVIVSFTYLKSVKNIQIRIFGTIANQTTVHLKKALGCPRLIHKIIFSLCVCVFQRKFNFQNQNFRHKKYYEYHALFIDKTLCLPLNNNKKKTS